jgi:putative nucleotidyltransferase with HDIG domain
MAHCSVKRVMGEVMPQLSSPEITEKLLASAEKLPPFPDVIGKLMPLIQNMAPVNQIEAVIKYDQAITARVLALSQSPHYARRQSIRSLRDAILCLGQRQLIQVVTIACSARYFKGDGSGYDLREGELWEHSVAVALMAELVVQRTGHQDSFTVYTAALLHDIGKTLLNLYVKDYFDAILPLIQKDKMRFVNAERQVFGIDHQQLGAMIARRWHFPSEVVTAIRYHHHPREAKENRDVAAAVYVANRMVSGIGIGCGLDAFLQPNQDEVFVELGITTRMVEKFMADLVDAMEEAKAFLTDSA